MTLRRSFWALAAIIVAATFTTPSAQYYLECGYVWTSGSSDSSEVYGWSETKVNWGCFGEAIEGVSAYAQVQVFSPYGQQGSDSDYDGSWGYAVAYASASLVPGEAGIGVAYGWGELCYFGYGCEDGYDDDTFYAEAPPPPPPPPPQYSASGVVFIDWNENGAYDSGDVPLSGTTVYLTDPAGTIEYGTRTTGSYGDYLFDGLPEGGYRVTHPVPDGYFRTTDDSVPFNVPPSLNHNFGVAQIPQCAGVRPPLATGRRGVQPLRQYRYYVGGGFDEDERDGIQEFFYRWAAANLQLEWERRSSRWRMSSLATSWSSGSVSTTNYYRLR